MNVKKNMLIFLKNTMIIKKKKTLCTGLQRNNVICSHEITLTNDHPMHALHVKHIPH